MQVQIRLYVRQEIRKNERQVTGEMVQLEESLFCMFKDLSLILRTNVRRASCVGMSL